MQKFYKTKDGSKLMEGSPCYQVCKVDDPRQGGAVFSDLQHDQVGQESRYKQMKHPNSKGIVKERKACDDGKDVLSCTAVLQQ